MFSRKIPHSTFLVVIPICAITLASAAPQRTASPITGREFVLELAVAARAANATQIAQLLKGVELGGDPDAALTERGAVVILQNIGVAASTASPNRPLSKEKAKSLARYVQAWSPADEALSGVLSTKGELPDTVDDCFSEKNHGACVDCCKEMGGGASSCAKACFVINKPSAAEPLP